MTPQEAVKVLQGSSPADYNEQTVLQEAVDLLQNMTWDELLALPGVTATVTRDTFTKRVRGEGRFLATEKTTRTRTKLMVGRWSLLERDGDYSTTNSEDSRDHPGDWRN